GPTGTARNAAAGSVPSTYPVLSTWEVPKVLPVELTNARTRARRRDTPRTRPPAHHGPCTCNEQPQSSYASPSPSTTDSTPGVSARRSRTPGSTPAAGAAVTSPELSTTTPPTVAGSGRTALRSATPLAS